MGTTATHIKAKLVEETKAMLFLSIYLAVFFCIITTYRGLISAEYHVSYFHYGYCLVEAIVLAKVILIGRIVGVGDRFGDHALIVPTLYKTLCFGAFIAAFAVLEHAIEGVWRHDSAATIISKIARQGRWEILFRVLVVLTALFPLFIFEEVGTVLGEGKLFELLFRRPASRRKAHTGSAPDSRDLEASQRHA